MVSFVSPKMVLHLSTRSRSSQHFSFWSQNKNLRNLMEQTLHTQISLNSLTFILKSSLTQMPRTMLQSKAQLPSHGSLLRSHKWQKIQEMIFALRRMVPFVLFWLWRIRQALTKPTLMKCMQLTNNLHQRYPEVYNSSSVTLMPALSQNSHKCLLPQIKLKSTQDLSFWTQVREREFLPTKVILARKLSRKH